MIEFICFKTNQLKRESMMIGMTGEALFAFDNRGGVIAMRSNLPDFYFLVTLQAFLA